MEQNPSKPVEPIDFSPGPPKKDTYDSSLQLLHILLALLDGCPHILREAPGALSGHLAPVPSFDGQIPIGRGMGPQFHVVSLPTKLGKWNQKWISRVTPLQLPFLGGGDMAKPPKPGLFPALSPLRPAAHPRSTARSELTLAHLSTTLGTPHSPERF